VRLRAPQSFAFPWVHPLLMVLHVALHQQKFNFAYLQRKIDKLFRNSIGSTYKPYRGQYRKGC
jgi:hypothetical protein